jgi:hypothetical protein
LNRFSKRFKGYFHGLNQLTASHQLGHIRLDMTIFLNGAIEIDKVHLVPQQEGVKHPDLAATIDFFIEVVLQQLQDLLLIE